MTFSPPDLITRARSTLDGAVISLTPCHFPKAQETDSRRALLIGDDFQENIVPRGTSGDESTGPFFRPTNVA
jgi:hypothetical protein